MEIRSLRRSQTHQTHSLYYTILYYTILYYTTLHYTSVLLRVAREVPPEERAGGLVLAAAEEGLGVGDGHVVGVQEEDLGSPVVYRSDIFSALKISGTN